MLVVLIQDYSLCEQLHLESEPLIVLSGIKSVYESQSFVNNASMFSGNILDRKPVNFGFSQQPTIILILFLCWLKNFLVPWSCARQTNK